MKTYLVQRLMAAPEYGKNIVSRTFGGIDVMSDLAWDTIQQCFDISYMGSAEFEFNAIPRALNKIVSNISLYDAWEFDILPSEVKPGWWRKEAVDFQRRCELVEARQNGKKPTKRNQKKLEAKAGITPIKGSRIWVIGLKTKYAEIEEMIRCIGRGDMRLKSWSGFDSALDPPPDSSRDIIGWFDIENCVLWFIDRHTWERTKKMLDSVGANKEQEHA